MTFEDASTATRALLSVALTIGAAEHFVSAHSWRTGGIFDWNIVSTLSPGLRRLHAPMRLIASPHGIRVLTACWAASGIALPWVPCGTLASLGLLSMLIAIGACFRLVTPVGGSGAAQMTTVLMAGLAADDLLAITGSPPGVGLKFVAAQACLAYCAAGVAKAVARDWRNGKFLTAILGSGAFGFAPIAHALVGRSRVAAGFAGAIIGFEVLFPVCILAPQWLFVAFLACGALMHICIAICMGLNTFLWAFLASYPALAYVRGLVVS